MKYIKLFIALIGIITIICSCKKDTTETTGIPVNIIFNSEFENQGDLADWTQSTGGQAVIDSSAVKFTNITECFSFETLNLIPVTKGRIYELKLTGKVNPAISGDPALCAGNFIIYVMQNGKNLVSESFGNHTSWTQESFSFETATAESIKIKFLIGTIRGAWIDDLVLTAK